MSSQFVTLVPGIAFWRNKAICKVHDLLVHEQSIKMMPIDDFHSSTSDIFPKFVFLILNFCYNFSTTGIRQSPKVIRREFLTLNVALKSEGKRFHLFLNRLVPIVVAKIGTQSTNFNVRFLVMLKTGLGSLVQFLSFLSENSARTLIAGCVGSLIKVFYH